MAYPDSTNVTPVFLELSPDWGKPISLVTTFKTGILVSREAGEQRARERTHPRYGFTFSRSGADPVEYSVQKARALKSLGAPVVLPIWTHPHGLVSKPSTHTAQLSRNLALRPFKVGSWAYLTQTGLRATFRLITAIVGDTLTFHATSVYPAGEVPDYTGGTALVYPCILGIRTDNTFRFKARKLEASDYQIGIEEL